MRLGFESGLISAMVDTLIQVLSPLPFQSHLGRTGNLLAIGRRIEPSAASRLATMNLAFVAWYVDDGAAPSLAQSPELPLAELTYHHSSAKDTFNL